MKKFLLLIIILFPVCLIAQTKVNCDAIQNDNKTLKNLVSALKQDTLFLRNKLSYYDKLNSNAEYSISSFNSQFDVKVLKCTGDRGSQTVKIEFVLHHKRVNQLVTMGVLMGPSGYAYDEIGNSFLVKETSLGSVGGSTFISTLVPTDIDVRGFIVFRGIIGGTDKFKLVQFNVQSKDNDGYQNEVSGNIDIRNIKIDWQ